MKVLIDMSDEDVENVKYCYQAIFGDMYFKMMRAIRDGIRIPDNATNGDVIEAMPNTTTWKDSDMYMGVDFGGATALFSLDWWNAPYKAESEDKE